MVESIYYPTVESLISALKKYPSDAKIIFNANREGYFTDIYPLNQSRSCEINICEGSYQNSVYIELK